MIKNYALIAKNSGLIALITFLLSGCHTITYVQYDQPGEQTTKQRWHHSTINGMVEISKPLNIQTLCGDKAWTTITSEFTFYNFLVAAITPSPATGLSLYTPWTNKVQCYETTKNQ